MAFPRRSGGAAITFQPMTEADLGEILEIERVSFSSPWTRDSFLYDLRENPYARGLVGRDEAGYVVAYSCCWHVYEELKINNLAVRGDRRGEGIGRALLRRALEDGRRAGC